MHRLILIRLLNIIILISVICVANSAPSTSVQYNLRDILKVAINNNPIIKSSMFSIDSAKGTELQASLPLNPNLVFEVADFAGNKDFSKFNGAEITASIQQTIETGGKRGYRLDVASNNLSLVKQKAFTEILAILYETEVATIKYFVAEKRLNLINKRLQLINKTHYTIKRRVKAAAASDIQHTKIDIEHKSALIEKTNAQKDLEIAKATLEKILSIEIADLKLKNIFLKSIPSIPDQSTLLNIIKKMPQSQILYFQQKQAESSLHLAKANSIPNPTISIGARKFNLSQSHAIVASISIPIPVFNRNQGQIIEANAALEIAKSNMISGEKSLEESIKTIWSQFKAAKSEALIYNKHIISDSQKAYDQALDGYDMGRFSFLDLLDSQRTLYKMQELQLENLSQVYQYKAAVDYLMGTHLSLIENTFAQQRVSYDSEK